jgi:hypothetical protein
VPGENLTKVEALTRSRLITVKGYDIEIDLRAVASSPTFRTTATVTFLAEPGESSFIDAIAHTRAPRCSQWTRARPSGGFRRLSDFPSHSEGRQHSRD